METILPWFSSSIVIECVCVCELMSNLHVFCLIVTRTAAIKTNSLHYRSNSRASCRPSGNRMWIQFLLLYGCMLVTSLTVMRCGTFDLQVTHTNYTATWSLRHSKRLHVYAPLIRTVKDDKLLLRHSKHSDQWVLGSTTDLHIWHFKIAKNIKRFSSFFSEVIWLFTYIILQPRGIESHP